MDQNKNSQGQQNQGPPNRNPAEGPRDPTRDNENKSSGNRGNRSSDERGAGRQGEKNSDDWSDQSER